MSHIQARCVAGRVPLQPVFPCCWLEFVCESTLSAIKPLRTYPQFCFRWLLFVEPIHSPTRFPQLFGSTRSSDPIIHAGVQFNFKPVGFFVFDHEWAGIKDSFFNRNRFVDQLVGARLQPMVGSLGQCDRQYSGHEPYLRQCLRCHLPLVYLDSATRARVPNLIALNLPTK